MLKEKVAYWSGPAAALGGVLLLLPRATWFSNFSEISIVFMNLLGLVLIAVGVTGLYLHLRASGSQGGSVWAFGLTIAGVILILSNTIIRLVIGLEESSPITYLLIPGILCLVIGLVSMAIITNSHKALGSLSFTPLALVGGFVALLIFAGLAINNPSWLFLINIGTVLAIIGWLLLGAALWVERDEPAETKLQM